MLTNPGSMKIDAFRKKSRTFLAKFLLASLQGVSDATRAENSGGYIGND
jgi:hypothetical protein